MSRYKCQDCGHVDDESAFPKAQSLLSRIAVGEIFTDKECPQCCALAHPVNEPSPQDWVCPECSSDQVQAQHWIDCNTEEVFDEAGGYYWCQQCEDNDNGGELNHLCQRYEYTPEVSP